MPVVGYRTRKVSTDALPGVRKSAALTSAAAGVGIEAAKADKANALSGLGDTISRAAAQSAQIFAQKEDDTVLLAADTSLGKWVNDKTFNPETGFQNVHGKDALGLAATVSDEFEAYASSLAATLKTDRQRAAFARVRAQHAVNLHGDVERHTFTEARKYESDELQSSIATKVNAAQVNAQDPRRVAQELAGIEANLNLHGPRVGMSPETVTLAIAKARSAVHVGVISNLLADGQHARAKAYFEEVRDQISGEQLDTVTHAVKDGSTRGAAQQASDAIIREGGTLTEQRDKAKAIEDPDVRDQALDYIEHEADIRKREAQVKDEDLMVTAGNLIDASKSIKSVPPALWVQLTPGQKNTLKEYAKSLVTGGGPGAVKTDPGELYKLLTLSSTNPDAFLKTNLLNYKASLSAADLEQMMRQQATLRAGDKSGGAAFFASEKIQNDMTDEAIRAMYRLEPTPSEIKKVPGLQESVDRFRRAVREAVARKETQSGKKATEADVQSIVDTLSTTVGVRVAKAGIFSRSYAPAFAFETAQAKVTTAAQVPVSERRQIERALTARGYPVTDTAIVNLFNEQLARTRKDK